MTTGEARELALSLAAQGFHVFPVRFHSDPAKNKTPARIHGRAPHGHHDATSDLEEVENLFNKIKLGPESIPALALPPAPPGSSSSTST